VRSAELFVPRANQFRATNAPSTARVAATAAPLAERLLPVAGGAGLSSAEAYAFATLKTDKDDYAPARQ
jgi:hypothetical protein